MHPETNAISTQHVCARNVCVGVRCRPHRTPHTPSHFVLRSVYKKFAVSEVEKVIDNNKDMQQSKLAHVCPCGGSLWRICVEGVFVKGHLLSHSRRQYASHDSVGFGKGANARMRVIGADFLGFRFNVVIINGVFCILRVSQFTCVVLNGFGSR